MKGEPLSLLFTIMSNKLFISIPTHDEPLLSITNASLQEVHLYKWKQSSFSFNQNHCTVFLPPLHYPPFFSTSPLKYPIAQSIFKDGSLISKRRVPFAEELMVHIPHLKTLLYHRASPKLPKYYPPSCELLGLHHATSFLMTSQHHLHF